jgi:SAM-dependent methyltransferase
MDVTKRFSSRVSDYRKYRPGYPGEIVLDLEREGVLKGGEAGGEAGAVVADVGVGTGLLARIFLERGYRVMGVEPNREMREAGEEELRGFGRYTSVDGMAEGTGLAEGSVDVVTAGQAFHWFKRAEARAEFSRILRGEKWVVLVWNERLVTGDAFLEAYEGLLHKFGTDYKAVDHRNVRREDLEAFYGSEVRERIYGNRQEFDFEGLKGRLMSSSYVPREGDERFGAMVEALRGHFERYERGGRVGVVYETKVYVGRV